MAVYSASSEQNKNVRKDAIPPRIEAPPQRNEVVSSLNYHFLQNEQIEMIDEALRAVGDFGEVRLVVERGRLRFLVTQKSFDMMKWQPGTLKTDYEEE